jgi:hypothetical protein
MGVFGEVALERRGVLSPRARLGALAMLPATRDESGLVARYGLQAGRLDVCPVLLGALSPCLRAEVGRIQGKTFGTQGARLDSGVWAATQLVVSARWSPVRSLFFELEGGAGPALVRPSFLFGTTEIYSVPPVVAAGGLDVGVHFP